MTPDGRKRLRGLIYTAYNSEAEMARQMSWNRQRLNKITTGKKLPDIVEINVLSKALNVGVETLIVLFLPE